MEEKIKKLSEKYLERVMELRRELHKYPEIGFAPPGSSSAG